MNQIGENFSLAHFGEVLDPYIQEVLRSHSLLKYRAGTILIPRLLMWLVLALTIRRDLSIPHVLNWMLSGFRWLKNLLPAKNTLLQNGAISRARVKLGVGPFRSLFSKLASSESHLEADFHGRITVIFDGSKGDMPDTEANRQHFNKPSSRSEAAAFQR